MEGVKPSRTLVLPNEILVVEDNPSDVELLQESLGTDTRRNRLHVVPDGAEAMEFLRHGADYKASPRPDLILLDLNLPRRSGASVLAEIKADPDLRCIPVVVFTSSSAEADITRSYELGANCYITKPVDLERFETVVHALQTFWLGMAKLPPT